MYLYNLQVEGISTTINKPKVNHSRKVTILEVNQPISPKVALPRIQAQRPRRSFSPKVNHPKRSTKLNKIKVHFFQKKHTHHNLWCNKFQSQCTTKICFIFAIAHKFQTNIFLLISLTFFLQFYFLQLFCF